MYIADCSNSRIRKITASTGKISTIAGTSSSSYSGDNGAATSAGLYNPTGVALDSEDNVYIADTYNNRVRKVTISTNIITTIAGTGAAGFSGDDGPSTSAELNFAGDVAVDLSGKKSIISFIF